MNENGIVVLGLFDGLSGGQIALNRLGAKIDKYYASEIDKYAIAVTQYNYPNTIQLGDVTKWEEWDIDWSEIDMVTGGFPCQSWSVSGKQLGDKDPRGMLFWTMLDIIKKVREHNSSATFLIENVKMKKEFEQYITFHTEQALGTVHKILVDSALVSAQSRKRYYWTNIEGVTQPADKGICLQDIIESVNPDSIKSYCIDANYFKGGNLKQYFEKSRRQIVFDTPIQVGHINQNHRGSRIYATNGKSVTLAASGGGWGMKTGLYLDTTATGAAERVRYGSDGKSVVRTELRDDGKSNSVIAENKAKYLLAEMQVPITFSRHEHLSGAELDKSLPLEASNWRGLNRNQRQTAVASDLDSDQIVVRMLTPIECERLQTVEDNWTKLGLFDGKVKEIAKTNRYEILGNGWTIDVIAHIMSFIPQIKKGEWLR